jgi:hypothetical protein
MDVAQPVPKLVADLSPLALKIRSQWHIWAIKNVVDSPNDMGAQPDLCNAMKRMSVSKGKNRATLLLETPNTPHKISRNLAKYSYRSAAYKAVDNPHIPYLCTLPATNSRSDRVDFFFLLTLGLVLRR